MGKAKKTFKIDPETLSSISWDGKMKSGPLRLMGAQQGAGRNQIALEGKDEQRLLLECDSAAQQQGLLLGFQLLIRAAKAKAASA